MRKTLSQHASGARGLLAELKEAGVELWLADGKLRFRAPRGVLDDSARYSLAKHRDELIALLQSCGPAHTLAPTAAQREVPLSFAQQRFWFLHRLDPSSPKYNAGGVLRFRRPIDPSILRSAVIDLSKRHPVFRARIYEENGVPKQEILARSTVELGMQDMTGEAEARRKEIARALRIAALRQPLDLAAGQVARFRLVTFAPDDHMFVLVMHHIVCDGISLEIVASDLEELYQSRAEGRPANLPPLRKTYADFAIAERLKVQNEGWFRSQAEFWREALRDAPALLELPSDRPRPPVASTLGARFHAKLDAEVVARLRGVAGEEGVTLFMALLAVWQTLLARLSGQTDVIVGTPISTRDEEDYEKVVGCFINNIALRGDLSGEPTYRALLQRTKQTVLAAFRHAAFPFDMVVDTIKPQRTAAYNPIFQVLFNLLSFPAGDDGDGMDETGTTRFDLSLELSFAADGGMKVAYEYAIDLFDAAFIERLHKQFVFLLRAAGEDPSRSLMAASLVPPEERHQALFNNLAKRLGDNMSSVPGASPNSDDISLLISRLRERDIRLFLDGGRLRINAPRGALDDKTKSAIAARRDEIIIHLEKSAVPAEGGQPGPLRRIPRNGLVPASSAQQRLWFLNQVDPGQANYNIGGGLRFTGPLDTEFMRQAILTLINRHEAFRTRIVENSGQPWLELLDTSRVSVDIVDLSAHPADRRDEEVRLLGESLLRTPFDMAQGTLAAFLIIRLAPDDHVILVCMHHVISDGWSLAIVCKEMSALYDSLAGGRAADLAPLPIDYLDYAAWEATQVRAGYFDAQLAYWKNQLKGAPATLELPTDRLRPPVPSHHGSRLRRYFYGRLIASLEAYSREQNATLFMTLLAAWQVLMYRYSGQDDIVVGAPVANRDSPELEGVIGCLVNNIPLRGRLHGNPRFSDFLAQIKQTTLAAFDHRALPFDKLVQALNPERSVNHAPIFQVFFTLLSFPVQSLAPAGLTADFVEPDSGASRFDLALDMGPVAMGKHVGEYSALYEFDSDLFDASTIARLHDHFANLLAAVAANLSCGIQDLPMITSEEERLLLKEWNATELPHDRTLCVHNLLEASARSTPDAPAVSAGGVTLTYRELDQKANRLAHALRRHGVGPGRLVAVCLGRTVDMPVALAAILKAGAAYVPLDPTHPADRLRYVIDDAEVSSIITMSSFAAIFDGVAAPILLLDEEFDGSAEESSAPQKVAVQPEELAYVIYTSGSTGRPKGVEVEHRNVVSFLRAMQQEPGLTANDALLAVTTLSFDIAGLEIWLPLSAGARVIVASEADVLDGARLTDLIQKHGITLLQATPASWRLLLEAGWNGAPGLKALCGGEAMPRDLAAALIPRVKELWNMYGPTETTIWSTLERMRDASGPITIGHPIANTRVFVLEPSGQLAPIGVAGELCISGEGVARGYRKRPELTSEKFVTITLRNGATERVYRTADMARFRSDGRLELLGRSDQQVKVRGYRVELGEIEAVLAAVPGVKTCVVAKRELSPGDERLVGYVTLKQGASFDAEKARATLRLKLPEYMVPNLFVVLGELPMTPNNKIDRKALPAPQAPEPRSDAPDAAFMTPQQRRVAELWRNVLRIDRVRLNDNFFDLGGHSLLLVKLHAELKREFGTDFPLVELFQLTTVASQANRLSSNSISNDAIPRARARAQRQLHDSLSNV